MQGYTYFLIIATKHRLWVLTRTALTKIRKMAKKNNLNFYHLKKSLHVAWACFRNDLRLLSYVALMMFLYNLYDVLFACACAPKMGGVPLNPTNFHTCLTRYENISF